jgi:hypothetical protein
MNILMHPVSAHNTRLITCFFNRKLFLEWRQQEHKMHDDEPVVKRKLWFLHIKKLH